MKRVLLRLSVIFLAIAALAISFVIGLSRFALPWVTGRVQRATGYQIVAQSMDFHFRRGVILKDVHVLSPEHKEVFAVHRFYVRPRWGDLIRRHEIVIEEVSVDMTHGQLTGRGHLSKDLDTDVRVEYRARSAPATTPPSGILTAVLVKGRGRIVASLAQRDLQLSATAQVDVPGKKIEATLRTGRYAWNPGPPQPWDLEDLTVELIGNLSRWRVQAQTHFNTPASLRYTGTMEKQETGWKIGWDRIVWLIPAGPSNGTSKTVWQTTHPGTVIIDQLGPIHLPELRLSDGKGRIHIAADIDKRAQDISIQAKDVSLGPVLAWAYPLKKIEGYVDATAHLQGSAPEPVGQVDVTVSSGRINDMAFQHVSAHVRLEPPWIVVEHAEMEVPQTGKNVTGSGRFPWHLIHPASPNLPMDLHFEATDTDPRFLGSWMPGWEIEPGGHLGIRAVVRGRYPDVAVDGQATLTIPRIRYADAGLELKDLNLDIQSHGKRADVKQGQAKMGKGTVSLSGKIDWPTLDLTLTANKATLSIPKQLELKTDSQIHLGGDLQAPELSGEVRPQEGTYTVTKKDKKDKKAMKDAQKPLEAEPSELWSALRMDIHTQWEHGIWYRDGLTKIETAANLRIRKGRGETDIKLLGPLTLVRGSYDAYGHDFVIDTGDLNFTGAPGFNPLLSIQAEYRTSDVLINLSVTGTAEHPKLKFTSSPPLSEQEIISVLVTGKSVNTFGKDTDSNTQARDTAAGLASSYLTQSLRSSGLNMGLDVVRVTPSATGTVWTVGRYLGPDLFVSYGQNPKDAASSVVNADYSLTRKWSIATQASSTSDTFVDFLFRYPLKARSKPK